MTTTIQKLDVASTELQLITATFQAIEASMSSVEYEFNPAAFTAPCNMLFKISEEISELTQQIFHEGAKNNE